MKTISNFLLAATVAVDLFWLFRLGVGEADPIAHWGLVTLSALLVVQILRRPPPKLADTSIRGWVVAIVGSLVPLAYRYVDYPSDFDTQGGIWMVRAALPVMLLAVVYLGSGFSLIPAARQVVARGPYRLVRHPLYAAYLVADASNWLPNGSSEAAAIWTVEAGFLAWRAVLEERCLLRADIGYSEYQRSVRWRLLPLVY